MIVYQMYKKDLTNNDFDNVRKIKYCDDNIILIQILPRSHPGEERKKVIIHSPASETNWKIFKNKYFRNEINSNI